MTRGAGGAGVTVVASRSPVFDESSGGGTDGLASRPPWPPDRGRAEPDAATRRAARWGRAVWVVAMACSCGKTSVKAEPLHCPPGFPPDVYEAGRSPVSDSTSAPDAHVATGHP